MNNYNNKILTASLDWKAGGGELLSSKIDFQPTTGRMKREDIIYLALLLICIPFGHGVKLVNSPKLKQFLTLAVGLIVALSTAGFEGIWHSALTILGNFILVKLVGLQYVPFLVYSLFFLLQILAPAVDKANLLNRHEVHATLRTSDTGPQCV